MKNMRTFDQKQLCPEYATQGKTKSTVLWL